MAILPSRATPAPPWLARRAGDDYGATADPDWREIDWRDHVHSMQIAGRKVNYVDIGESRDGAAPVLFVHGLAGCWQNWLENIPRVVAEGRRVIAPDLPGFGLSEMPAEEISISGYGRCVEALCDELGLGEVVVVGNSMGGFVAAEKAIQFPDRVERLVLVSAAGISQKDLRKAPAMVVMRVVAELTARAAAQSDKVVTRPRLREVALSSIIRHPSRIKTDLLWEITTYSGGEGYIDATKANLSYDFQDRLGDIRVPTLIVWGGNDMIVPTKDAHEYERLISGSRKVVMEDTGHVPMIERAPTFNDELMEFLAEEADAPERKGADSAAGAADSNGDASVNGDGADTEPRFSQRRG
jgi:pimeloyl-ACP methyl ester carboxylesterase